VLCLVRINNICNGVDLGSRVPKQPRL
jgi:hypothetical protein